jgi:hypothetical protein
MFQSVPSGARVYVDNQPVGITPCRYSDSKTIMTSINVKLEKDGYQTLETIIDKDEEVDVGMAVLAFFFLVPGLWALKYKPLHTYELKPVGAIEQTPVKEWAEPSSRPEGSVQPQPVKKSKAERLREMKQLLDDKIITQEEFEKEKKKILDEPE